MSSWYPQEFASGCWMSNYRYQHKAGSSQTGHEFMLHATLEPGAERYFSGLRIFIGSNAQLAYFKVHDNVGLNAVRCDGGDGELEKPTKLSLLEAQEKGRELAMHWSEGDPCVTALLPLCTLVFEVVDKGGSNLNFDRMELVLHPPEAMDPQSLCTLYDYVLLCTPTSRSCVLFLITDCGFRRSMNVDRPFCISPDYPWINAHGVRILPPSASRQPYINLPQELLRMIFKEVTEATKFHSNWQKTLVSLALVCRAWTPALDNLYEVFVHYNRGQPPPNASQLAKTLEISPYLGEKIRVFETIHFRRTTTKTAFLQHAKAIVTILETATRITDLTVSETHTALVQAFIHALCSSSQLKFFAVRGYPYPGLLFDPKHTYILNVGDVIRCMSHWHRVERLMLLFFPSAIDSDDLPTSACSIKSIVLRRGSLMLQQLRLLTTSWKSALQEATLQDISGLTNEDLRSWLSEVGPTLTSLIIRSSPLSRRSDEEEYAVDVVMPVMVNLSYLDLEGDVVSELTLLRYVAPRLSPCEMSRGERRGITINDAPGLSAHGFLSALKTTAWPSISVWTRVVCEENKELNEEAQRIAKRRNITLQM